MTTIKTIAFGALLALATTSFAHENHGLTAAHWHPSDTLGLSLVAAGVALALWLARGRK